MASIRLFTIRGIPVRMHITFPLILLWAAVQFGGTQGNWLRGAAFGIVFTLLLFVCVVLHELAHSVVAIQFGSRVHEITLLPLGGVAQMEHVPEKPLQELAMSVAGPLTSGVIGVGLAVLTVLLFPLRIWGDFLRALGSGGTLQWAYLMPYLAVTNLFLALFNLLPAFPMDGGRVLRALLAAVLPYGRATVIAIRVGQGLAWMIGLAGLLARDVFLILIALFVYAGAAQEGRIVQLKTALAGLRVRQVYSHPVQPVQAEEPLSRVVDLMLSGFQTDFPVCDGERLIGMLSGSDVLRGLKERGPDTPISEVMQRNFFTVQLEDDLFDVQQRMSEQGLEAVPVVEGSTFLGLLTRRDLEEAYRLVLAYPALLPRRSAGG
ncbi:MAG: site-2 protease family protein [Anaerolineae bacterium]|nr:site-2 protease family protein [Anaerolineae bacterium]MCX8066618.1 site-2 protease family protein [Anaerolineae bacterium]MDW7991079.1 site-2 protease family protein [Anaerolineae bacterium]